MFQWQKKFSTQPLSSKQVQTVKDFSLQRKDGLGKHMQESTKLNYHTSCYATYTSKSKIDKFLKAKRKQDEVTEGQKRKHLRSWKFVNDELVFEFEKCCLFCGKECIVIAHLKHQDRCDRNPGVFCRTGKS